jgi:uncharacterized membrane protein
VLEKKTRESSKRSLAKAITYRLYQSFLITPIIAYLITGSVGVMVKMSVLEFLVKIPSYYLFERAWAIVPHGYRTKA